MVFRHGYQELGRLQSRIRCSSKSAPDTGIDEDEFAASLRIAIYDESIALQRDQ